MTWLKLDDKLTTHPKWLQISVWADDIWLHASVWCASHNNDGVIPDTSLHLHTHKVIRDSRVLGPGVDMVDSAIRELVRAGLWRRRPKRDGGGWDIVNWLDYQPSKQTVRTKKEKTEEAERRARLHKWLHNNTYAKRARALILERDGHWCRYCEHLCTVNNKDQKGPSRLTFDLIDPADINIIPWEPPRPLSREEIADVAARWAIACGYCNAVKAHRTPEEAEMPLLPAPQRRPDPIGQDRTGSGKIGSRSDQVVGSDRAWPGLAGAGLDGTGLDGTGLDGTGLDGTGLDGTGLDGTGLDGTGITAVSDPGPIIEPAVDDAYFASLLAGR